MNFSDSSYSPDFAEYITLTSSASKYKFRKILIILLSAIVIIAMFCVFMFKPQLAFFALIIIFAIAFAAWYFWRFCSVEYEYVMAQGEMQFDIIYSAKQRKKLYECKISKMQKIAPISSLNEDAVKYDNKIYAASGKSPDNEYYAIIENDNSKIDLLIFEANEKTLKIMKSFNMRAFI